MQNEFGVNLDRNGYAPSILQNEEHCFICFGSLYSQRHEVFHGSNREKSKEYGLWVKVCPTCHYKIHNTDGKMDRRLKKYAQEVAMKKYGWSVDDFIKKFGRNYT